MARQTSIDVYNQIKREGLLSRLRFDVYDALFQFGPLTSGELWVKCFPDQQRPNISPRFAELEKLGVIRSLGKKECGYSGRQVLLWDVTGDLPVEPIKEKTKDEWIFELTMENTDLKKKVEELERKLNALLA